LLASRLHWRLLIGTILVLMAAAWLAPLVVRPPDIQENRVLAAAPAWPRSLGAVQAFRKAADPYVADHFPARPHLIGLLNRARMLVGVSGSNRVIIGRHGWLFFDDDTHLGAARGDPPMTGPEIRQWLLNLAGRTEMLKARGVPYLIVAAPVKETVYPQHGPAWYHGSNPNRPAITLPKLAQASGAGEVLYLYPAVAAATAAGQATYTLHDTHWDGYGAYAGYAALLTRLHAMGLTDGPRPLSDFLRIDMPRRSGPRDLALMLGVSSFVDLHYPNFDTRPGAEPPITRSYLTAKTDWTAPQVVDTGHPGKPVLLMNRDSFSNEMLVFLFSHFSRIILVHNQDGFWRADMIDRFKPDIVLLEVIEPGLRVALGVGPAPSKEAAARIDHVLGTIAPSSGAPAMPRLAAPDARTLAVISAAAHTDNCHLEAAAITPDAGGEATFTVSGWLSELGTQVTSPDGVVAITGPAGVFSAPIKMDKTRPDVAAFYKNPNAAASGFTGTFFVKALPAGVYRAMAYRRAGAGWIACAGKESLSAP
jgi:hypothetical protein